MIIFQKHEDTRDQKRYLQVIITIDDIFEKTATFQWEDIPDYVADIFEYVSNSSALEEDTDCYKMYGSHIGRPQDHKYLLATIPKPYTLPHIPFSNSEEDILQMLASISSKMKIIKKL